MGKCLSVRLVKPPKNIYGPLNVDTGAPAECRRAPRFKDHARADMVAISATACVPV